MTIEERQEPEFRRVEISDILNGSETGDVQIEGLAGGMVINQIPMGQDNNIAYVAFLKPLGRSLFIKLHSYASVGPDAAQQNMVEEFMDCASMLVFSREMVLPVAVRGTVVEKDDGQPPYIAVKEVQLGNYKA